MLYLKGQNKFIEISCFEAKGKHREPKGVKL